MVKLFLEIELSAVDILNCLVTMIGLKYCALAKKQTILFLRASVTSIYDTILTLGFPLSKSWPRPFTRWL